MTAMGLSDLEAARRLARDGPNALPDPETRPAARIALQALREPMILLLLAAGGVYLALGDLKVEVVRTVVQGDMCAAHCHVVGRHVGTDLGGPATGAPVSFWGITILRADKGRIVEGWNSFDFLSMYQQIGWVPNPVLPIQP